MELFLYIDEHFTSHFLGRCLHFTLAYFFTIYNSKRLFRDYGLYHYLYNMPLFGHNANKPERSAAFIFVLVAGTGRNIGI